VVNNLYCVNHIGGAAGHFRRFATYLGVLRPFTWFTSSFRPSGFCRLTSSRLWSIAGPVIGTFSRVKLILGKRQDILLDTSLLPVVVYVGGSCTSRPLSGRDQNNFCLTSLFGWGLLYRTRAFASPPYWMN